MRFALALIPALMLAGCGGGSGDAGSNSSAPVAQVSSVAAPAGQQWSDVVEKTPEGGFRMGNPNAPIKLIEYGSRTCSHCAEFSAKATEPLKTKYIASGRVSWEYRDFLRSGADLSAALVSQCGGPGPFFTLLDQMFAAQPQTLDRLQKLPESFYKSLEGLPPSQQATKFAEAAGYLEFVKQRGIPENQARQCLADEKAQTALTAATQDAISKYSIPGTPTFLINGEVVDNTASWEALEPKLRAAGG